MASCYLIKDYAGHAVLAAVVAFVIHLVKHVIVHRSRPSWDELEDAAIMAALEAFIVIGIICRGEIIV